MISFFEDARGYFKGQGVMPAQERINVIKHHASEVMMNPIADQRGPLAHTNDFFRRAGFEKEFAMQPMEELSLALRLAS